jgi:hypothetical protein
MDVPVNPPVREAFPGGSYGSVPLWRTSELGGSRSGLGLRERLHHRQEFVTSIALRPGELEKLLQLGNNSPTLWRTGDDDGSSTAKLQEPFISKDTECAQHSIGVDPKDGSEILGLRDPISRVGLAVGDGTADLRGNLIVERHGIGTIDP